MTLDQRASHPAWLRALPLFLLTCGWAVMVGLAQNSHISHYDEFYHMLPALNWNSEGSLRLLDGEYTRASLFTVLVATFLDLFGQTFEAGRLTSAAAGLLLIAALFVWVCRQAGALAALLVCVVLTVTPSYVFSVGQIRFYVVHALVLAGAGMILFHITSPTTSNVGRIVGGLILIPLLLLGLHLQPSTLVAIGAMGLWLMIELRQLYLQRTLVTRVVLAAGALIVLAAAWATGFIHMIMMHFMSSPLWAAEGAARPLFYIQRLGDALGPLWAFLPLWIWLGYRSPHRRLLAYAAIMFLAPLAVHSMAAQKADRYLLYALPWLAVLIGVSLSPILQSLHQQLGRQLQKCPALPGTPGLKSWMAGFVLTGGLLGGLLLEPTLRNTLKAALAPEDESALADWGRMVDQLKPLTEGRTVVVTEGIKAAYYLGDYDYDLNLSVSLEVPDAGNFGIDPRTGRHSIGLLSEMQNVLNCHPRGLVIIDEKRWRTKHGVTPDVADLIEARTQPLMLGREANFRIYAWEANPPPEGIDCSALTGESRE